MNKTALSRDFYEDLVFGLLREKQNLIRDAVDYKIGHSKWTLADISGRCQIKMFPDKTEIFAFDGEDLIYFAAPATIETNEESASCSMEMRQQYKLLYAGNAFGALQSTVGAVQSV